MTRESWPLIGTLCAAVWIGAASPVHADRATLSVPVDAPGIDVQAGPDGLADITCPRAHWLGRPGDPRIPWRVMTVLLPPDVATGMLSVRLTGARYEAIPGQWDVGPVPPESTWHEGRRIVVWPTDKTIVNGRDAAIYGRDAAWPSDDVHLLGTGRLRKWRLADVAVPLLRFNPVQGALVRLVEGDVEISFKRRTRALADGAARAELADTIGRDTVRRIAVNFDQQCPTYGAALAEASNAGAGLSQAPVAPGYVIVTTSAVESASSKLADFVALKERYGFAVQVITEGDFGGGVGDAAAENIRAWLQGHYVCDNILYVLLIGNPDPSSGQVPMKMLWPRHGLPEHQTAPSDFYYADLTGNWDFDGDGYYGEFAGIHGELGDFDPVGGLGVDRHWEVLVGRIPFYGSIGDLDDILSRIIDYQRKPGSQAAWRTNALLPMVPSDGETPGYHLGERINNEILAPAGWSSHRIYEQDYGLVPPPETTPCNKTNVTNVWSNGSFGLAVWWTHGSTYSATNVMDTSHVPSLNDDYPAFTFQVSCHNAYPEASGNLAYALLKHGGICTIGATRVSWFTPGQTSFYGSPTNAGMGYAYAYFLVDQGMSSGRAMFEFKQQIPFLGSSYWMNYTVFNIYGDPSTYVVSPSRALSLQITTEDRGSVLLEPNDPNWLPNVYPVGTELTLTAVPAEGRSFKWWRIFDPNYPGDSNHATTTPSDDPNYLTLTLTMDADWEVEAVFNCGSGMGPLLPFLIVGSVGIGRLRRRG